MDDSVSNAEETPVTASEGCVRCEGGEGCACLADPDTGFCALCDAGDGQCPCPSVIDDQLKIASNIRKAAQDTPFILGL